jgi:hypothetical protein
MNEKKLCFSIGVLSVSYIVISVTKTSFQRGSLQVAISDFHVRKPNHYYLYLYVLCPVTIFLNSIYDPSTVQKREFLSIDFSRGWATGEVYILVIYTYHHSLHSHFGQ